MAEDEAVAESAGPSLRTLAVRGSKWTILGFAAAMVLRLAVNVLLARLLFPADFGMMALVTVFVAGLQMFSDLGIGPSLIRSPRGEEPIFRDTAFTIQVIRGFILWLAACAVAWPAAKIYHAPQLLALLPVAGFITVLGGFTSTAPHLLNRRMEIGRITVYELLSPLLGTLATCLLAYLTQSVWALVGGQLIQQAGRTLFSFTLVPGHRDRFRWDRAAVRELFGFGRWIFLSTLLTFLAAQADRILLGRLLTLQELGVYSIAIGLAIMPQDIMSRLTSAVQFPALAQHAFGEPERLFHWLARSREALLWIGMTMTLGIAAAGPSLFALLYDQRYQDAGWIAQMVSVAVWITMLQMTCDRALLALGDSRTLAASNLARFVTTIAVCLIGFKVSGLKGFLVGLPVGSLAGHLIVATALWKRGHATLRVDLGYSALFAAMLVTYGLLAHHFSGGVLWWGRVDPGVALAAVMVLAPLLAWSAFRLYKIAVVR